MRRNEPRLCLRAPEEGCSANFDSFSRASELERPIPTLLCASMRSPTHQICDHNYTHKNAQCTSALHTRACPRPQTARQQTASMRNARAIPLGPTALCSFFCIIGRVSVRVRVHAAYACTWHGTWLLQSTASVYLYLSHSCHSHLYTRFTRYRRCQRHRHALAGN